MNQRANQLIVILCFFLQACVASVNTENFEKSVTEFYVDAEPENSEKGGSDFYIEAAPGKAVELEFQIWSEEQGAWSSIYRISVAAEDRPSMLHKLLPSMTHKMRVRTTNGPRTLAFTIYSKGGRWTTIGPQEVSGADWLVFGGPGTADYKLCCFGNTCSTLKSNQICAFSTWTCTGKEGNTYTGCTCTKHCG